MKYLEVNTNHENSHPQPRHPVRRKESASFAVVSFVNGTREELKILRFLLKILARTQSRRHSFRSSLFEVSPGISRGDV